LVHGLLPPLIHIAAWAWQVARLGGPDDPGGRRSGAWPSAAADPHRGLSLAGGAAGWAGCSGRAMFWCMGFCRHTCSVSQPEPTGT